MTIEFSSKERDCGGDQTGGSQLINCVVRKGGSKTFAFARLRWCLITCDLWQGW